MSPVLLEDKEIASLPCDDIEGLHALLVEYLCGDKGCPLSNPKPLTNILEEFLERME